MKPKIKLIIPLMAILLLLLAACGKENNKATLTNGKEALGFAAKGSGESGGVVNDDNLAIVVNVDTDNKKVIIYRLKAGEKVVLTYSGSTGVLNKYGDEMTMAQVGPGEIVEAEYKKGTQKLIKLQISDDAWEYKAVSDLEFNEEEALIKFGKKKFFFEDESLHVFSNKFSIELRELDKVDELTVRGVGNIVYSIEVTKGHGYIKIQNADYFEGGIIEVGTKNIHLITKDMVIVAKEGDYLLTATKGGVGGSRNITVLRNEELAVDISVFQEQAVRIGSVNFTISPSTAILYINGTKASYSGLVSLPYGTHTIKVMAEGYASYTETMIVDSIYEDKGISLIESQEEETQEQQETQASESYTINVSTPVGAEVYFDGVLKGVAPVGFNGEGGSHAIILRKTGYESKSYTIYISSGDEGADFSFPELTLSDS